MAKSELPQKVKNTLELLPTKPGVYLMKDDQGTIIYVGKAKSLRNRVRSYFTGEKDVKTRHLVRRIADIDYIVAGTEFEALVLENNLIKTHSPRYNINLKDGKTYPVIRITNEEFPRVFRTRRVIHDGSEYFGPFTDIEAIDRSMDVVRSHFPLRFCKGKIKKKAHPCLYYHINRCSGLCAGKTSPEEYHNRVDSIRSFLKGDISGLKTKLESQMEDAAQNLRFEQAAKVRDAIRSVERVHEQKQRVMDFQTESKDYIAVVSEDQRVGVCVLSLRNGKMEQSFTISAPLLSSEEEVLESVMLQLYGSHNHPPKEIVCVKTESPIIIEYFETLGVEKIRFTSGKSKRDGATLAMAMQNAREEIRRKNHSSPGNPGLRAIGSMVGLAETPQRIEGFDIAHLHGKHTYASVIVYDQGKVRPSQYRILKIKSLNGGIDDFQSMHEAVARRYSRLINEEQPLPDVILIDGGKGQVHSAMAALKSLDLSIPVVGLAKKHEELFYEPWGAMRRLPPGSPALRVFQSLRDEAHRFSTKYNKKARVKDQILNQLTQLPGVGQATAKRLIKEYKSIKTLYSMTPEEFVAVAQPQQRYREALEEEFRKLRTDSK